MSRQVREWRRKLQPDTAELVAKLDGALAKADTTEVVEALALMVTAYGVAKLAREVGTNRMRFYRATERGDMPLSEFLAWLKVLGHDLRTVQPGADNDQSLTDAAAPAEPGGFSTWSVKARLVVAE